MTTILRALDPATDLVALAAADPSRFPALLESAASGGDRARYDILFACPEAGIELRDGRVRRIDGDAVDGRFLDALDAAWQQQRLPREEDPALPFHGGWLLFLGYELAGEIEPRLQLPTAPDPLPTALALRCPAAIVRDHATGTVTAIAEAGRGELLQALVEAALARSVPDAALPSLSVVAEPAARFLDGVAAVKAYLAAGDVFQVNLSRRWRVQAAAPLAPGAVYRRLRRSNPGPFAALLRHRDGWLASSSPERLVAVRGSRVETRPIAGTRPRLPGDDDAARVRELAAHPKERAEHVMLIDLERNDLGRVCRPGSVVVEELMAVESYAHVHHIESTVAGRLRPEVTPGQVIAAVFPGGTITGCPKVRCMQIIAELENEGRGAYTGAIGYLGRDGDLDLNILIRTLVGRADGLAFRAGAGIVADSEPEAELAETEAKARGLLRALEDAP